MFHIKFWELKSTGAHTHKVGNRGSGQANPLTEGTQSRARASGRHRQQHVQNQSWPPCGHRVPSPAPTFTEGTARGRLVKDPPTSLAVTRLMTLFCFYIMVHEWEKFLSQCHNVCHCTSTRKKTNITATYHTQLLVMRSVESLGAGKIWSMAAGWA